MDEMSAIEIWSLPSSTAKRKTPSNCPHELIREGDYVFIVMLTVLYDMAAPSSRIRPSICKIQPKREVDQQQREIDQQ